MGDECEDRPVESEAEACGDEPDLAAAERWGPSCL